MRRVRVDPAFLDAMEVCVEAQSRRIARLELQLRELRNAYAGVTAVFERHQAKPMVRDKPAPVFTGRRTDIGGKA